MISALHTSVKSAKKILDEAQRSGELHLKNRKLKTLSVCVEAGYLPDLTFVDCSYNLLLDVPNEICEWQCITMLNLSHNFIKSIPEFLTSLCLLEVLDLSNNLINRIPLSISDLSSLIILNLQNNKIVALPSVIGKLKNCEMFNISNNKLTSLPEELGNMTSLKFLDFSYNNVSVLPEQLSHLGLLHFNARANQFITIPLSYQDMIEIQDAVFDDNPLTCPSLQSLKKGRIHMFKSMQSESLKNNKQIFIAPMPQETTVLSKAVDHSLENVLEALDRVCILETPDSNVDTQEVVTDQASPPENGEQIDDRQSVFKNEIFSLPIVNGETESSNSVMMPVADSSIPNTLTSSPEKTQPDSSNAADANVSFPTKPTKVFDNPESEFDSSPKKSQIVTENNFDSSPEKSQIVTENNFDSSPEKSHPVTGTDVGGSPEKSLIVTSSSAVENVASPTRVTKSISSTKRKSTTSPTTSPRTYNRSKRKGASSAIKPTNPGSPDKTGKSARPTKLENHKRSVEKKEALGSRTNSVGSHSSVKAPTARVHSGVLQKHSEISKNRSKSDFPGYAPPPIKEKPRRRRVSQTSKDVSEPTHYLDVIKPRAAITHNKKSAETDSDVSFTVRRKTEKIYEELELLEQLRVAIESALKMPLPQDLLPALTDGVMLCHLANHIKSRSIPTIHIPSPAVPKLSFAKCRRNVDNFLDACKKLGVPEARLCTANDIMYGKGLSRMLDTVQDLLKMTKSSVKKTRQNFSSPSVRIAPISAPANKELTKSHK